MFRLTGWDAFLLIYVVSVGVWLLVREYLSRRQTVKDNLQGQITLLREEVANLSGEVQRLSSIPPPPPVLKPASPFSISQVEPSSIEEGFPDTVRSRGFSKPQ